MATPVIGLDIEAMGKIVSRVIARFDSTSIRPCASKCVTWPLRATAVTAPEMALDSIARPTT